MSDGASGAATIPPAASAPAPATPLAAAVRFGRAALRATVAVVSAAHAGLDLVEVLTKPSAPSSPPPAP